MDKMIQSKDGETIITNDGATIMSHMQVFHPTAKMLVELSRAQDVEAGAWRGGPTGLVRRVLGPSSRPRPSLPPPQATARRPS